MGIKKLKPVDSIVAEISPQVVCDDLARNSMEWLIKTAVTSDRHTIYTALREGILSKDYDELDSDRMHNYDRARQREGYLFCRNEILTLLDELFGVSK